MPNVEPVKKRRISWGGCIAALFLAGIVAAILYPVFSNRRECAGACDENPVNNIRQLGFCFELYANDNDNHYPNCATLKTVHDAIYPYVKMDSVFTDVPRKDSETPQPFSTNPNLTYRKVPKSEAARQKVILLYDYRLDDDVCYFLDGTYHVKLVKPAEWDRTYKKLLVNK